MMTREELLYNEFKKFDFVRKNIDGDVEFINLPRIFERLLENEGNLQFVDEAGYDFLPDLSDAKIGSVRTSTTTCKRTGKLKTTYRMRVTNASKLGALRVIVANVFSQKVDYFFLPNFFARQKIDKEGNLNAYYNLQTDKYPSVEEFRVDSLTELANIVDDEFV